MAHYSTTSPLGFEELNNSALPQLNSPYNPQLSSHSTSPSFLMLRSPLPSPSPQPSPMSFISSPRHPPINTPQSITMTSPRHSAMTPPMLSPAARKASLGRRGSRQKSRSIDQTSFDRNDLLDGFTPGFDVSDYYRLVLF